MAPSDPTFDTFPDLTSLFDSPSHDEWRAIAEKSLKGRPLEKLSVRTHEGLSVDPLFTDADSAPDPGLPGSSPHLRGRTALGAGPTGWTVCQAVNHPDPDTAARLAAENASRGVDASWLVFDTSVRTAAENTNTPHGNGIRITSSTDLDPLFEHLDLAGHSLHLSAGGNTPAVAAAFLTAVKRHVVNPHELSGSLGFDPLGALAGDGALTAGIDGSFALMAEIANWTRIHSPKVKAIAADTTGYHMAGATAVQELAYGLATAIAYIRALEIYDIDPDTAASQLIFRHAVGRDLFMEVAKFRACRRLWSRAAEACGISEKGRAATTHAVASPRELTTRDPWVNALRTTSGSFAAVVGGADMITVLPFDHAIGQSDELGRRVAANSQTILAEESNLARVVDPGGGSWYLEHLTDRLAQAAWTRFQAIEAAGGMAEALVGGAIAAELEETREKRLTSIATLRDPVTGVSSYPNLGEDPVKRPAVPSQVADEDSTPTEELARLFNTTAAPIGDGTVVDAAIAAAAAGAGIGPLAVALRGTRDGLTLAPLPAKREAEPFEHLRDASDIHLATHGVRPRIFLANMGPVPEHKPRATFAKNFFEAGGIETLGNDGFDTVEASVEAFGDSGATMAVICSSDARYPDVVPDLAAALEGRGARTVLVAGKPGDHEEAWRKAGVTGFIHMGCNVYQMLVDLLQEEGVLHV